jgi:hypothetical protein
MYANHKSSDQDKWCKDTDDCRAAHYSGNKSSTETPAPVATTPSQKLTLNDKLCNAFCAQAGLSAEAIDCIRADAQGNE